MHLTERLVLVVFLAAFFFLARWVVLPYIPFPTDDVIYEESRTRLHEHFYAFPLAPYILRVGAFAVKKFTMNRFHSGMTEYDWLAQAQMILLCIAAGLAYLTVRHLTSSRAHSLTMVVLLLASCWTFQYILVISHAIPVALFFMFALYSALMFRSTLSGIWAVCLAGGAAALMLVSSSGIFWAAVAAVWATAQFAAHRVIPRFAPVALIPIAGIALVVSEYRKYAQEEILTQYMDNLIRSAYTETNNVFGETFSTLKAAAAFDILYMAPALSALAVVVAVLAWRSRNVQAVALTIVVAYVAAEYQPYTKLARSFYPFVILLALLVVVGMHSLPRNAAIVIATTLTAAVIFDVVRCYRSYEYRFALYREVHPIARNATIWHTADDHHAKVIIRALSLSYGSAVSTRELGSGTPAQGDIVLFGPRGPFNGRSVMRACLLPTLMPLDSEPRGQRLPYPGFWPSFQLEQEVCQNLFIGGRAADPHHRDNLVVLRRIGLAEDHY